LRLVSTPTAVVTQSVTLAWSKLCAGELRIVRYVQDESQTTVYLEDRRAGDSEPRAIRGRTLDVLQRVLGGQSLNFIALDVARSCSTISAEFKVAMGALGLTPRLSGLPLFLVQLWHATLDPKLDAHAVRSESCTMVTLPRPDLELPNLVSCAELQVCRMLLQGCTHAEIATVRGTSLRTVANQIASIFDKLKVSGRLELVTRLAQGVASRPTRRPTQSPAGSALDVS
jgi:DNA-binding NarL/FixJ family response regulator